MAFGSRNYAMPGINLIYMIEICIQLYCQNAFGEPIRIYFKSVKNWTHIFTVLNIIVETCFFFVGVEYNKTWKIFRIFGLTKLTRVIGLDIFKHYQEVKKPTITKIEWLGLHKAAFPPQNRPSKLVSASPWDP
jgi:hypothetical protein